MYANNGNLTSDGTNSYTWDRANRLLSMGGASYQYDGLHNRIQQTAGANVTKYLLDLQPGLAVVLAETTGANVIRNVHWQRGIHAHEDASGTWAWVVQDGLGSVRGVVDNTVGMLESRNYDPYGTEFGATGTNQTSYGYTGEPMDSNGLLYLRARYYNPAVGVFTALDPFEGMACTPMSLNRYSYVAGNPVNMVDPSGKIPSQEDITSGRTRYSCKCGWLDGEHVSAGRGKARNMFNALTQPVNWQGVVPNERVIIISGATGLGPQVVNFFAYIPDSIHSDSQEAMFNVALGVLMAYEQEFESTQAVGNLFDGFLGKRASGFAEEDLVSDLVGVYFGRQEWLGSSISTNLWTDASSNDEINQLCGDIMSEPESEHMRLEYEANGGFQLNWNHWYKRDRPQGTVLPQSNQCVSGETWPSELTTFATAAVPPEGTLQLNAQVAFGGLQYSIGGLSSTGWWIIQGLQRWSIDNFRLLRLESDYLYTIPQSSNQGNLPKLPPNVRGKKGFQPQC